MTAAEHHRPIVETPPAHKTRSLVWESEDDTAAFAQQLAALPGIANAFLSLQGDLGAGKTTLVRHLLRALGVQGRIKSPTYAVVEPHEAENLAIWHFDFYRFSNPREWEDAGFRELFASTGLKLAEWPEKAAGLIPPADLAIHIEALNETARRATLQAGTPHGEKLLQGLRP
ncbi:MAG: tRNA (adenosine(37)-N6)-threonylcarbamoyltransferase complex ATPase subunit type 1 TsaE [Burkholderiaceae bacterium]|nr:tRNA (adenosine(37)-N6)-threonylcarbamoyltransferase complex ATPase subunit type 1 TsaE [Burkholderiaceae bacterium]